MVLFMSRPLSLSVIYFRLCIPFFCLLHLRHATRGSSSVTSGFSCQLVVAACVSFTLCSCDVVQCYIVPGFLTTKCGDKRHRFSSDHSQMSCSLSTNRDQQCSYAVIPCETLYGTHIFLVTVISFPQKRFQYVYLCCFARFLQGQWDSISPLTQPLPSQQWGRRRRGRRRIWRCSQLIGKCGYSPADPPHGCQSR